MALPSFILKPVLNTSFASIDDNTASVSFEAKYLEVPSNLVWHTSYDMLLDVKRYELTCNFDGTKCSFTYCVENKWLELIETKQVCDLLYYAVKKAFKSHFPSVEEEVVKYFMGAVWTSLEHMGASGQAPDTECETLTVTEHTIYQPNYNIDISNTISSASKGLPGMNVRVEFPCDCNGLSELWNGLSELWLVVQHLNDKCGWTREKIADWIDKLHDDGIINAEFQPWDEVNEDPKEIQGHDSLISWKDEISVWEDTYKSLYQGSWVLPVKDPKDYSKIIGDIA